MKAQVRLREPQIIPERSLIRDLADQRARAALDLG
jgi:hypothetical protein